MLHILIALEPFAVRSSVEEVPAVGIPEEVDLPQLPVPEPIPVRVKGLLGPICPSHNDFAGPVVSPQYIAATVRYLVDDYRLADVSEM